MRNRGPVNKGTIFTKPRYVSRYPFKTKPVVFTGPMPDPRIGVPMVGEIIPGPMPVFISWITVNPTSVSFYCW